MTALLLALLLFQAGPTPKGFATGIVRSASGTPAAGVRVYATPAGDPSLASTGAAVFESLAQTDASGRYRLEIPAGRYYIAVGSVSSPTYFPDTTSLDSAKAISIAAGTTVESVDFSRYIAAVSSPSDAIARRIALLPPNSTGILSGVVRTADGPIAMGVSVRAVPVQVMRLTTASKTDFQLQQVLSYQPGLAPTPVPGITDGLGRYRIENIPRGVYVIMAGFSDSPVFYPGKGDLQTATIIETTPTTLLTNLDFELPPPTKTFSVRGRVLAGAGRPVGGATVNLQGLNSGATQQISNLLPTRSYKAITTGGDGTFEIPNVLPGKYSLQARLSVASLLTKSVEVTDHPVEIDFELSVDVLSGRIVLEDGSPFLDPAIGPVAVSTTSSPNFISTTLLPVANNGAFSGVIDQGDYRFYIRSLPAEYTVRAMTFGSVDLAREPLQVKVDMPNQVEIRVAKELRSGTRVSGRVVNAVSGAASAVDRVELCCFTKGPFERLSSAVLRDGSFDFLSVPPGRYTAELLRKPGQGAGVLVNQVLEVGDQEKAGLLLVSAAQVAPVTVTIAFEGGDGIPSSSAITVALQTSPGVSVPNAAPPFEAISIPMNRLRDGTFWLPFPPGVRYSITLENIPEGYRIKSIFGPSGPSATDAVPASPAGEGARFSAVVPADLRIVLERMPVN